MPENRSPVLADGRPEAVGLSAERLSRVAEHLETAVRSHTIPGGTLVVARHGVVVLEKAVGIARPADMAAAANDTIWLTASLSKPVTYMGLMLLVERGALTLDQPVKDLIPEFAGAGREGVKVVHLMTHTSGLPDMPPHNEELRKRHAPLADFIAEAAKAPLAFPAGTKVSYQSSGTLLCAHIVEKLSGMKLGDFLQRELFAPLGLADTYLGLRKTDRQNGLGDRRLALVRLTEDQDRLDWTWNSEYWRNLGAPWGALQSTPREYAAFLQLLLNGGRWGDRRILSPSAARAIISDTTARLPRLPADIARTEPWALGWMLQGPADAPRFGDLVSPNAFGHWGSCGTVAWSDPASGLLMVMMTNEPLDGGRSPTFLRRLSNLVAASVE